MSLLAAVNLPALGNPPNIKAVTALPTKLLVRQSPVVRGPATPPAVKLYLLINVPAPPAVVALPAPVLIAVLAGLAVL